MEFADLGSVLPLLLVLCCCLVLGAASSARRRRSDAIVGKSLLSLFPSRRRKGLAPAFDGRDKQKSVDFPHAHRTWERLRAKLRVRESTPRHKTKAKRWVCLGAAVVCRYLG